MTLPPRKLRSAVQITMILRPLQAWWAYLGIRSNPAILSSVGNRDRAIFFEDVTQLRLNQMPVETCKFFRIFWDGISGDVEIEAAKAALGPGADLTPLVVGNAVSVSPGQHQIRNLYPDGKLIFESKPLRLDRGTHVTLLFARLRSILVPIKNLVQSGGKISQSLQLLFGRRQVVFCGSFGTTPRVLQMLCARHGVNFELFAGYEYFEQQADSSFSTFSSCLTRNAAFLADLYDQGKIDSILFLSVVHLLGRGYFIERLKSTGTRIFANGLFSGRFVDVYTTPFYAQHLFLDFGSVVGHGNYPRLADLSYFKKEYVQIDLHGSLEAALPEAREGQLTQRFEREWESKFPQIASRMRKPSRP